MNRQLVAETLSGRVNDGGGRADQVEYRVLGYTVLGTLLGVLALQAAGTSFSVFGLAFGALIGPIGMVAAARWFRRRRHGGSVGGGTVVRRRQRLKD